MQGPAPIQLEGQTNLDMTQLQSVAQINNAFFHVFGTQKLRQLVDICPCQILRHIDVQGTSVPNYYIKIGTFAQKMDQLIYVKAVFQNLVTFVFENAKNQTQLFLLSLEVENPSVQSFCESIKQATQVVDYKSDSFQKTSIKQKMDTVIDGQLTQDMIENIEYIGNILKSVGGILGTVSKSIIEPAAKAETIMHSGFQILSQKMVSEQNKQRWNTVKQTASTWNEKMTEMYKPIDNAFKMIVSAIGQNFNKSENKYIKNIKKFSKATASALNNSYKRAQHSIMGSHSEKENQGGSVSSQNAIHEQSTNELNN